MYKIVIGVEIDVEIGLVCMFSSEWFKGIVSSSFTRPAMSGEPTTLILKNHSQRSLEV